MHFWPLSFIFIVYIKVIRSFTPLYEIWLVVLLHQVRYLLCNLWIWSKCVLLLFQELPIWYEPLDQFKSSIFFFFSSSYVLYSSWRWIDRSKIYCYILQAWPVRCSDNNKNIKNLMTFYLHVWFLFFNLNILSLGGRCVRIHCQIAFLHTSNHPRNNNIKKRIKQINDFILFIYIFGFILCLLFFLLQTYWKRKERIQETF